MSARRSGSGRLAGAVTLLALTAMVWAAPPVANAATAPVCAQTLANPAPGSPSPGSPCWTDVVPYPFGFDGNPVDLTNPTTFAACNRPNPPGPAWAGDYDPGGAFGNAGNPPCYLQVTSMAFRAWNRGLAATGQPRMGNSAGIAFGVWLYNGTNWFPDPTFPGAAACPGTTVLWAGKLDYWLVGSSTSPTTTLCRFDGVNLAWEPLSLPQATLGRLPLLPPTTARLGGITGGTCYAWNNCWFFGDDGIMVHWDGQALSDQSGLNASPWLQGDFTGAVSRADAAGNEFGLAITKSSSNQPSGIPPLPAQPDGSAPPQVFGSQGGPFSPLGYSPPATSQPGDPFTTDLVAIDSDPQGDVWVAGDPAARESQPVGPTPLLRLTPSGAPASCPGYDASTFTVDFSNPNWIWYRWNALSVFPSDGSALAAVDYETAAVDPVTLSNAEPAIVQAACGQAPITNLFRIPDPRSNPPTAPVISADPGGAATAVAALADNDAWAATTNGGLQLAPGSFGPTKPHLYLWTDGQSPNAPAGDDIESRPSLFTLDPPVYSVTPTVVVPPPTKKTVRKRSKPKTVKLKPAIYDLRTRLHANGNGTYILYISFRVRRAVTIGLEAYRGSAIVASSGLVRFTGHTGVLSLTLTRQRWPTRLAFLTPKQPSRKRGHR